MRNWRRAARWGTLAVVAGLVGSPARGQDRTVTLDGWAGTGVLVPGAGLGADLVRLIAEAHWAPGSSRDPGRYSIRSTFPDGHAETRPFPIEEPPGRARFVVYLPADPFRNLNPDGVHVEIAVLDAATGSIISNPLTAGIAEFPRFKGDPTAVDTRPFGWGKPLPAGAGAAPSLPNPSPDGFDFVRIPADGDAPGFFISRTEASVADVVERIPVYNPKANRSDEFALDAGDQPAVALTPAKALDFLRALGANDPTGVGYRLPTVAEWTRAAQGGKVTAFWWGDEPTNPAGANLLGAEPSLLSDTTAPTSPADETSLRFAANPYGLYHAYGNVAEWAGAPEGGFARMGGDFRTEPAAPLPAVVVAKDDDLGPNAFVGVRPALDLTPPVVEALVRKRLAADPKLAPVRASFDPATSTVTLRGKLDEASTRREADRLLEGIWFLAAVDNQIETPRPFPGQLGSLSLSPEPAKVEAVLDRSFVDVPIAVRWFDPLPVIGSHWWVNIYLPGGEHLFHKLTETEAGRYSRAIVSVDRAKLMVDHLADATPFSVAISLGEPAPLSTDPHIVTNLLLVKPTIRAKAVR